MAALLFLGVVVFFIYNNVQKVLYPVSYEAEVQRWATEYEVDPLLVYAVIRTESSFDPKAESSAGARGLMQMTGETFDWIKSRIARDEELQFDDLYDPGVSIRFGVYYLAISLERYGGDVSTAAAAYHSGWGTVDRLLQEQNPSGAPPVLSQYPYNNMRHYVRKINSAYQKYQTLYGQDA